MAYRRMQKRRTFEATSINLQFNEDTLTRRKLRVAIERINMTLHKERKKETNIVNRKPIKN